MAAQTRRWSDAGVGGSCDYGDFGALLRDVEVVASRHHLACARGRALDAALSAHSAAGLERAAEEEARTMRQACADQVVDVQRLRLALQRARAVEAQAEGEVLLAQRRGAERQAAATRCSSELAAMSSAVYQQRVDAQMAQLRLYEGRLSALQRADASESGQRRECLGAQRRALCDFDARIAATQAEANAWRLHSSSSQRELAVEAAECFSLRERLGAGELASKAGMGVASAKGAMLGSQLARYEQLQEGLVEVRHAMDGQRARVQEEAAAQVGCASEAEEVRAASIAEASVMEEEHSLVRAMLYEESAAREELRGLVKTCGAARRREQQMRAGLQEAEQRCAAYEREWYACGSQISSIKSEWQQLEPEVVEAHAALQELRKVGRASDLMLERVEDRTLLRRKSFAFADAARSMRPGRRSWYGR